MQFGVHDGNITRHKFLVDMISDEEKARIEGDKDSMKFRGMSYPTNPQLGDVITQDEIFYMYNGEDWLEIGNEKYVLPTASASALGGIKVGTGLYMSGDSLNASGYSLPTASNSAKGGVVIGAGLSMSGDTLNCTITDTTYNLVTASQSGLMSAQDKAKLDALNNYELPVASESVLGGIKIGSGLEMQGDSLNCTVGGRDFEIGAGLSMVDNTLNCTMTDTTYTNATSSKDGLLSKEDKAKLDTLNNYALPTASNAVKGGIKVGNGLSMNGETLNVTISGGTTYTLPTASSSTKGGVKIGKGLQMSNETLNCTLAGLPLGTVPNYTQGWMWIEVI